MSDLELSREQKEEIDGVDIDEDLRNWFSSVRERNAIKFRQPDEFTMAMFIQQTGMGAVRAESTIRRMLKDGEIECRPGASPVNGKVMRLFRIKKK